ncbi:MAG TPA: tRNA uridine-5-carboxymethylaminomethyl(34) synthesis GTPase MnmE [Terriglobales bacterium]|jgi:tRNA modification GTPase
MHLDDTIVAIATPQGRGGIGIVRIAGPAAVEIALQMLRLKHRLVPGQAMFGDLVQPGGEQAPVAERLDEVVVTYFAKPHSYTTDDIVEISAHGSPVVLNYIVETCLVRGARLAQPGEFTSRAFLNGRIDLTQAEAVRDLIESQTLYQAKVAAQQLGGAFSHRIYPVKKILVELIANLEAGIDFAEDDLSVMQSPQILEQIEAVRVPLTRLAASFSYGRLVHQGLILAIVGKPNVGKSSLFNRLVERERAIVTATPGTTRDLVSETVAIGGIPVRLMDTAGIRHALDEAESIGVRKSMEALADADLVLLVVDASQLESDEDAELLSRLEGRRAIVVGNKADLIEAPGRTKWEHKNDAIASNGQKPLLTSALSGDGIHELRAAILAEFAGGISSQGETGLITSLRHQNLVTTALTALDAAHSAVRNNIPHEMILLDLYNSLHALDEITGATTTEDILNLIFSTFCIGK